jgi:hypothetical protein
MSTSDNVFVAAEQSAAEVSVWLADVLGLEPVVDHALNEEERLFRRAARTASGEIGVLVRPNSFAEVDPEPDEIQAIDRYPIDLSIRLVGHNDEEWQLRETQRIFDDLATERPDVPTLLVHNLDTLVCAHLPGAGTHSFDPLITPDAPDIDTWRSWVVAG